MNDPIVEETRKYREQYAARFNYDLVEICRDLQRRQATCGRRVVSRPPKKIPIWQQGEIDTGRVAER
jgi:hypothetical protein